MASVSSSFSRFSVPGRRVIPHLVDGGFSEMLQTWPSHPSVGSRCHPHRLVGRYHSSHSGVVLRVWHPSLRISRPVLPNQLYLCRRNSSQGSAPLPPELQKMIDDYDRMRAEEEAQKSGVWKALGGRYGVVVGASIAFFIMFLFYSADDVSSELHFIWGYLLRQMEPEAARKFLLQAASWRLLPRDYDKDDPYLVIEPQEGLKFITPVGLAAGIDTEASFLSTFFDLGFGFIEVGPVLDANPDAFTQVWKNLYSRDIRREVTQYGLVSACAGGTKDQILHHLAAFGPKVQTFSVDLASVQADISSAKALEKFTRDIVIAATEVPGGGPRVFLRLAASQTNLRAEEIATSALAAGASGLVICHDDARSQGDCRGTDESRSHLRAVVAEAYRSTQGQLVIIASGGLRNGRDAMDAVEAGATVVQISTLLLSEGPQACRRIKNEMSQLLMNEGWVNLQEVVGSATIKGRKRGKKRNPWKPKVT